MAKFNHQPHYAWLFILPQLLITLVFFIWPACKALIQSFFYTDAFGLHQHFAGLSNFIDLAYDPNYLKAVGVTFIITFSVTLVTIVFGLWMAVLVNQRNKSQKIYKTLLIWPYAIAPAVAGITVALLMSPYLGMVNPCIA